MPIYPDDNTMTIRIDGTEADEFDVAADRLADWQGVTIDRSGGDGLTITCDDLYAYDSTLDWLGVTDD